MAAINGRRGLRLRRSLGNGPYVASEKSERRRSREWFPKKPLNAERWGKCFITVPPHTPFPPFRLHLPPRLLHPRIHNHICLRRQNLTKSERWRRRKELRNRRKWLPEPAMMRNGCHRRWGRRSSIGWYQRAFFQIASRLDGDQPTVSPIPHPILMKLWYLKITFSEGWGSLFTLFLEICWSFGRLASATCTPTPYCTSQSLSISMRHFWVFFRTSTSSGTCSV